MPVKRDDWTDADGRAYAGSQLQIQIYVNRRQSELREAVMAALPELRELNADIRWVSPLESDQFEEYYDGKFLEKLGFEEHVAALKDFWPSGGPNWDALAKVEADQLDKPGVLLVEAKSYLDEIVSSGCQAKSPASLQKINAALEETKNWIGVPPTVDWKGRLYQMANRYAHLYFLRQKAGVPAWLANVCFLDDPHKPTTEAVWRSELPKLQEELGLAGIEVPHTGTVFLPARQRAELL